MATRSARRETSSCPSSRSRDRSLHSLMLFKRAQRGNSTKILGTHLLPRVAHATRPAAGRPGAPRRRSRARPSDRVGTRTPARAEIATDVSRDNYAGRLANPSVCRGSSTKCVDDFMSLFRDRLGINELGPITICRRTSIQARVQPIWPPRCRIGDTRRATGRGSLCRSEAHVSRSRRRGACRCVASLADELPTRHLRHVRHAAMPDCIARSAGTT